VADQKPPRLLGDDRAALLALLPVPARFGGPQGRGISEEDARPSPVASGTSLLALAPAGAGGHGSLAAGVVMPATPTSSAS
jgi:hypothetical protein